MSVTICARVRGATGAAGAATEAGAGLSSMTRGFGATGAATASGRVAKIGAGCGPCCKNSALTKMIVVASVPISSATDSRGCSPIMAATRAARVSRRTPARSLRYSLLRTFLHLVVGHHESCHPRAFALEHDRLCGRTLLTIDRQTNRHARAFAEPASNTHFAVVQTDEPFDDRKAETGTIVAAVIGRARLEEGLAQARQIVLTDADAGIFDREHELAVVARGADRDVAVTRRELHCIGNEIDQDLVDRAPVGHDLRQILRDLRPEIDTGITRFQSQDVATADDRQRGRKRLARDLEIASLHLRHVEDAVDDREQMTAGIVDEICVFELARGAECQRPVAQHVRETNDGVERRA